MSIASLTPMQRTTYWRVAGIAFCLAEYALGKSLGIDPLTTLIPLTFGIFSIDQIFYRGAAFETIYQKIFPEYKKKIIYHEAGHFLLAYLLGIPVRGCVTNAWDARKYPDIKGQAGTIFFDPKLSDELLNSKITRSSLDRMSVVLMAGIAAEAIRFGKAEGGAVDEQNLVQFLTSIQPPWNILRVQGQARWAAMQAILLIKEHENSYNALCVALEEGKSVGDAILAIEDNLPILLPSAVRITDRKNRKKTMESDLLMRYIQKITWKVGGIDAVEYDGNIILGENPHDRNPLEKKTKINKNDDKKTQNNLSLSGFSTGSGMSGIDGNTIKLIESEMEGEGISPAAMQTLMESLKNSADKNKIKKELQEKLSENGVPSSVYSGTGTGTNSGIGSEGDNQIDNIINNEIKNEINYPVDMDDEILSVWKECMEDIKTRIKVLKDNDGLVLPPLGTLEEQVARKQIERKKAAQEEKINNKQAAVVGTYVRFSLFLFLFLFLEINCFHVLFLLQFNYLLFFNFIIIMR